LVCELKKNIQLFFGEKPDQHENLGKIINEKQFDRIVKYFSDGTIVHGGKTNKTKLYIEPTLLDAVTPGSSIMTDEIFGPVLPVISFDKVEDALAIIHKNKNPLAFYIFTADKQKEDMWLSNVAFGGGCVNNASFHLTNHNLPFGGRGFSGSGQYHGKFSFDTFSHKKSIMKTPTWFDPAMKYPPFKGKLKLLKWIIR
ncbi:MAG: aldehyde dehydrogenase family protein, partial [Ferruginibacter sp.]